MNNELIGIISNEGELKGVIEDNSFNVIVQITESGPRGPQGKDGYTPVKGVDYFDGEQGPKGDKGDTGDKGESGVYVGSGDMPEGYNVQIDPNGDGETLQDMIDSALLEAKNSGEFKGDKGEKGTDGVDGYTPQKGVDYYTDADKAEMVSAVLAALPVYEGEVESV